MALGFCIWFTARKYWTIDTFTSYGLDLIENLKLIVQA
jgi:hypothetical protein